MIRKLARCSKQTENKVMEQTDPRHRVTFQRAMKRVMIYANPGSYCTLALIGFTQVSLQDLHQLISGRHFVCYSGDESPPVDTGMKGDLQPSPNFWISSLFSPQPEGGLAKPQICGTAMQTNNFPF